VIGTFIIIDLSGFSALTEAHGDEAAVALAQTFAATIRDLLPANGRLLKTMGDAGLIVIPDTEAALDFVSALWKKLSVRGFLMLRAGIHHGEAVEIEGDVFGAAVNLTARLAALATAGQIVASGGVAAAAAKAGFDVTGLGPFSLKNLRDPVELYSLRLDDAESGIDVVDPVCRMRVEYERAAGRLQYEGREYSFCSLECASRFADSPSTYAAHR